MQDLITRTQASIGPRIAGRKAALNFSGGKDSQACLELLRPHLDNITVYWLNTGDTLPETVEVVKAARATIPHFVEIRSDVRAWRQTNGHPVDLVPVTSEPIGMMYGMAPMHLTSRFTCCFNNLMLPMHQRMVDDGIEVVIRGTKMSDTGQVPAEGQHELYDLFLPLRDWTHTDVFTFLADRGVALSRVYAELDEMHISAPECLHCTAWWDDNKGSYLKRNHPEVHREYRLTLSAVRDELRKHIRNLDHEIGEDHG